MSLLVLLIPASTLAAQEVVSLLAQGVDVDQRGEYDISALHLAALHGHTDTVERWGTMSIAISCNPQAAARGGEP